MCRAGTVQKAYGSGYDAATDPSRRRYPGGRQSPPPIYAGKCAPRCDWRFDHGPTVRTIGARSPRSAEPGRRNALTVRLTLKPRSPGGVTPGSVMQST